MFKTEIKTTKIDCQACHGTGLNVRHGRCRECSGTGLAYLFNGRLFFWQAAINPPTIYLWRLKKILSLFVDLFLFGSALLGLGGLIFWLFENKADIYLILNFWSQKSPYLLYFWLGLFCAMYLTFRISFNIASRQMIIYKSGQGDLAANDLDVINLNLRKLGREQKINIANAYRLRALDVIDNAFLLAQKMNHLEVEPLHLLYAALKDYEVRVLFYRLELNASDFAAKIKNQLIKLPTRSGTPSFSVALRQALLDGYFSAYYLGQARVKVINVLPGLYELDQIITELFLDAEISLLQVKNAVNWFRINDHLIENYQQYKELSRFKPASNMDRAYTAQATPLLNTLSHDLTKAAKYFSLPICVARESEMIAIFDALKSGKKGVLLVGDEGVGKKNIIGGLAQLMVAETVPEILRDKRLVELDVSRLISGVNPAQAEERLLAMLTEVVFATNIIIVVNNIETIVGISSGSEASLDLADVLVNSLEQANLICLATVSTTSYSKYIEGKPIDNIMQKVVVTEPTINQAIEMLESKISQLEGMNNVRFAYSAIEAAVVMTAKYEHDRYLPEKAIAVLNALAVSHNSKTKGLINKESVAKIVSEQTGILLTKVGAGEGKELLKLEENMHQFMIGQTEAVDMIAASLRRARTQLTEGKRPIASFLFLGPTGVGKTELAKTLAKTYFGGEQYMVRIDMSEYQNQGSISKMIGTSEDDKGYLTEAVRKKPFCLLLLDEFEKAHPDILNLFLQVMDDGRLTDGAGKTIDFTNCIIIATSNAGANFIQAEIKKNTALEAIKEILVNEHLNQIMRPELINRFDGLIVFKPLTENDIFSIAKLSLDKIGKNLAAKGIGLRYSEAGVKILSKLGYDVKFGARPLRRLLQDRIENKIADNILSGDLRRRDILVINDEGEATIEKAKSL
ncbi:MAG: AAA family ATPase [bacterium]